MFTIKSRKILLAAALIAVLSSFQEGAQETQGAASAAQSPATGPSASPETSQPAVPAQEEGQPRASFFKALGGYISSPQALRPSFTVLVDLNLDSTSMTSNLAVNGIACGLEYPIGAGFQFEPALDIYWGYYQLSDSGRAVPCENSERDATVAGFIINLPVTYVLGIGKRFDLAAGIGPAVNLRACFRAARDVSDSTVAAIASYMWSEGRFFVPSSLFRASCRASDRLSFSLSGCCYWPIFNFWAGDVDGSGSTLSFFDQFLTEAAFSVRIKLR